VTKKRPLKLGIEPIVEAIIELRFARDKSGPIQFGTAYSVVAAEFPILESQPFANIPLSARVTQPGVKYLATHHASTSDRQSSMMFGEFVVGYATSPRFE